MDHPEHLQGSQTHQGTHELALGVSVKRIESAKVCVMGSRPDPYTREIAAEICKRLAAGESLLQICDDPLMPHRSTVYEWVTNNRDDFADTYARARDAGLDRMADEVLNIADDGSNDWMERNDPDNPGWQANGEHQARSRLRVDTRKWYLSKLAPKRYGDKLELSGPDGQALGANSSHDALSQLVTALLDRAGTRPSVDGSERQSLLGPATGSAA